MVFWVYSRRCWQHHYRDRVRCMDITTKRCSKCGVEYPATREYFSPDSRTKNGLQSSCKACGREYRRQIWNEMAEEVRAQNRLYYARNVEIERARSRKYALEHVDQVRKYMTTYRAKNAEKSAEYMRWYYAEKVDKDKERERLRRYNAENREKLREYARRSYQLNKDKALIRGQRRLARKQGLPDTLTTEQWRGAIEYFGGHCVYCGIIPDLITVDHYVPLANAECPGTVVSNIVPACKPCNSSKGDRDAYRWLTSRFGAERAKEIQAHVLAYFSLIVL